MILYFSGTGNSRYAALCLARLLEDEAVDVTMELKNAGTLRFHSEKPYVFVSPTYAWRIPRVFEAFLKETTLEGARRAYFVMTCGSEIGDAGSYLQKLTAELGLEYAGVASVRMAENYLALFETPDRETTERLTRAAGRRTLPPIAETIKKGGTLTPPKSGVMGFFMSHLINPVFYPLIVKAKPFWVEKERCVGCGLCEKRCPLGNIRLTAGVPVWGRDCTHCMACIGGCPTRAIEYGKVTKKRNRVWNVAVPEEEP